MANIYLQKGMYLKALTYYLNQKNKFPESSFVDYNLGIVFYKISLYFIKKFYINFQSSNIVQ